MENKIKIIQNFLKTKEMILVDNPEEVFDLLEENYSFNFAEYEANLLIGKEKVFLITDFLLYPMVKNLKNINILKGDTVEYLKNGKIFLKEWIQVLKSENITRVGLVNISLSVFLKDFITFKFITPSKTLGSIKTDKELLKIKNILKRMNEIFENVEKFLKKGIKDIELRNYIDILIYRDGFKRYLPTYVGFNPKTIYPTLNGDILKNNQIVLIDIGIMKDGAGFSLSKTFTSVKISKSKENFLKIVKDGIEVLLSGLLKNDSIKESENAYRNYLKSHNLDSMSMEYGFSYLSCAGSGEVNTFITERKVKDGEIFKLTSSVFLPSKYGARFEKLYIKNKNNYEEIL